MRLQPLDWESQFFGVRMASVVLAVDPEELAIGARADVLTDNIRGVVREAVGRGFEHLSLRAPAEDPALACAAERCGFQLRDVSLDMMCSLDRLQVSEPGNMLIRPGNVGDIPVLQDMTEGAFPLTRFSVDPFFSKEQTSRFYRTWAARLFDGLADVVLIAEVDDVVSGFVSCTNANETGRIPLLATRADRQRKGVGRALVGAALAWFARQSRVVYVKTQAANYRALALYARAGFIPTATELNFSLHTGGGARGA